MEFKKYSLKRQPLCLKTGTQKIESCLASTKIGTTVNIPNLIRNVFNTNLKVHLRAIYHNCQYLEMSICKYFQKYGMHKIKNL